MECITSPLVRLPAPRGEVGGVSAPLVAQAVVLAPRAARSVVGPRRRLEGAAVVRCRGELPLEVPIHSIVPPGVVLATAPEHFFFYLLGPGLGHPLP